MRVQAEKKGLLLDEWSSGALAFSSAQTLIRLDFSRWAEEDEDASPGCVSRNLISVLLRLVIFHGCQADESR